MLSILLALSVSLVSLAAEDAIQPEPYTFAELETKGQTLERTVVAVFVDQGRLWIGWRDRVLDAQGAEVSTAYRTILTSLQATSADGSPVTLVPEPAAASWVRRLQVSPGLSRFRFADERAAALDDARRATLEAWLATVAEAWQTSPNPPTMPSLETIAANVVADTTPAEPTQEAPAAAVTAPQAEAPAAPEASGSPPLVYVLLAAGLLALATAGVWIARRR